MTEETTYLRPNSQFLLHLCCFGGKNPFFPPLPTFNLGICSEGLIDWFLIYLSPLWLWYESTLSRCPEQMPSIYFLFLDEQRITFFDPQGGGMGENFISLARIISASHHNLLYSFKLALCRERFFRVSRYYWRYFFYRLYLFSGSVFPCK